MSNGKPAYWKARIDNRGTAGGAWKWKVIRVDNVTIAQGWECPDCGLIRPDKICNCRKGGE